MTTTQDGGRLWPLRTGRFYPQEIFLVIISVRGWVHPRIIVRSEGFYVNEKSTGIEPATFRFVAQHFNRCATAVPSYSLITSWSLTHLMRNVLYLNECHKLNGIIAVYVSRPEVFIIHVTDLRSTNTVWIPVARWQPVTWFIQSYELFSASQNFVLLIYCVFLTNTGLSKKMDGIWNRYNLKSTGRIYTFGVLKCSEEFKVLDLP